MNFDTEPNYLMKGSIEKVHTAYMKNTLNVLSLPATCVCIVNSGASLFFIMPGHWP